MPFRWNNAICSFFAEFQWRSLTNDSIVIIINLDENRWDYAFFGLIHLKPAYSLVLHINGKKSMGTCVEATKTGIIISHVKSSIFFCWICMAVFSQNTDFQSIFPGYLALKAFRWHAGLHSKSSNSQREEALLHTAFNTLFGSIQLIFPFQILILDSFPLSTVKPREKKQCSKHEGRSIFCVQFHIAIKIRQWKGREMKRMRETKSHERTPQ